MHAHEPTVEEIAALKIPDGWRLAEVGTPMLPNGAFRLKWVEEPGSMRQGLTRSGKTLTTAGQESRTENPTVATAS